MARAQDLDCGSAGKGPSSTTAQADVSKLASDTPLAVDQTGEFIVDLTGPEPRIEVPPRPESSPDDSPWLPDPTFRYGGRRLWVKRTTDRVAATIAMIVLSPLLAAIAVSIKATSPGPVFFRQQRVGRFGVPFTIVKFRTMHTDAEERLRGDADMWDTYVANDFKLDVDDDPRVTRLGGWLRKRSLDELPQLINILQGHMSLVGPRPVIIEELAAYGPFVEAYLHVYPGLTGIWQVQGRNNVAYPERALLDVQYANE